MISSESSTFPIHIDPSKPVWSGAKEGLFDGHAIAYGSDAAIDWRNRLVCFTDRVDIGGGGLYVLKWTGDDKDKPIAFITQ